MCEWKGKLMKRRRKKGRRSVPHYYNLRHPLGKLIPLPPPPLLMAAVASEDPHGVVLQDDHSMGRASGLHMSSPSRTLPSGVVQETSPLLHPPPHDTEHCDESVSCHEDLNTLAGRSWRRDMYLKPSAILSVELLLYYV